jgi:hypothetical protein
MDEIRLLKYFTSTHQKVGDDEVEREKHGRTNSDLKPEIGIIQ